MNLTELKTKSPSDLMTMASDMGIENIARARKQEVIFSILKSHAKNGETYLVMECLKSCKMGLVF